MPALPHCRSDLSLVGTVVNEQRPRLSRVVVRTRTGASVVSVGGRVEDFIVAAIQPTDAALRGTDGALCTLGGFAPGPEAPRPGPAPAKALADEPRSNAPRGKPVFSTQELADGVRLLAHGEYLVSRTFLLKALTNPGGAAGSAWFRPAKQQEGRSAGMEMLGVRTGSALDAMGMRSGDVVQNINGISLDAASGLIAALRAARESEHISLAILRDGKPSTVNYRIE